MNRPPEREETLFAEALDRRHEERAAFLDQACGADSALRARITALLAAHDSSETALQSPVAPLAPSPEPQPGDRLGRYKLLQKIGEGGCGIVYMADQFEPVHRRVALKVIKLGMDTKEVIARFEAERQALALMDHSNIAHVYDAGATETGRPFFVMELVRGIPLVRYCDEQNASTAQRLELFIQICHAVQHAHQKGIIHRDLKPSNILVTVNDGVAVPKIIDFGIAKATQGRLTDQTVFTAFEQFIGTPAYMSPEQAVMTSLDVDTRSDIYSLGVLLYELLTGRTPFDAKELAHAGIDEIRRRIREVEPPRPSTRLSTMEGDALTLTAQRRQTEPPKLINLVRGDLDWIVMKAIEKDRSRRYQTPSALAADVARHLNHEPVVARPPSTLYRFQKLVRRNRLAFAAGAAVALALVLGLVGSTWQAYRAIQAEREQSRQRQAAEQARAEADAQRRRAEAGELLARRRAYAADMNLAQHALALDNIGRAKAILDRHRPAAGESDLRGWEWRYLWQFCRSDQAFALPTEDSTSIYAIEFSPDGKLLVTSDQKGRVKLWDLALRRVIHTFSDRGLLRTPIAVSPSGKFVAFAGVRHENVFFVSIVDLATRQAVIELPQTNRVISLAFTLEEQRLVTLNPPGREDRPGRVIVWDLVRKQAVFELPAPGFGGFHHGVVAVSLDAQSLAIGRAGGPQVVDLATGKTRYAVNSLAEGVTALAYSPDSHLLAVGTGYSDGTVRLYDAASGILLDAMAGHRTGVNWLRFTPDGRRLLSASGDQTIRVWDVETRSAERVLKGHLAEVFCLAPSPDGATAISGAKDGALLAWNLRREAQEPPVAILPRPLRDVEFSQDGRTLCGITPENSASVWSLQPLREVGPLPAAGNELTKILRSPDGRYLVAGSKSGEVRIVDAISLGRIRTLTGHRARVVPVGFLENARILVTVDDDGGILQWNTASWDLQTSSIGPGRVRADCSALAATRETRWLLLVPSAIEEARQVVLWDLTRPAIVAKLAVRSAQELDPLAASPDGQILVTTGSDAYARLWSIPRRTALGELRSNLLSFHSLNFSPDGSRLATGGNSREAVKLWDLATQREVITLAGSGMIFKVVRFSPDGNTIVGINLDSKVHLWRAPSWAEIAAAEKAEPRSP